jgi:8-oxo-dGTP pyrophosphatase MutT (NUDIX family)
MWRTLPGASVLVVRDDCVLMVRHERSGRYRWELPSGLVDPGETFEQAVEHETLEETGIIVSITWLLCIALMEVSNTEYLGINTLDGFRMTYGAGRKTEKGRATS